MEFQSGNYTSQSFANIYLNELDQYIKQKMRKKHYFRYMDDFCLLVKTKQEAIEAWQEIEEFLAKNLELRLNNKTQIFKSKQGVNFCGYKINENRMKIRDDGKRKLKKKVEKVTEQIKNSEINHIDAHKYIAGHSGYMEKADVWSLKNKLFYLVEG